MSKASVSSTGLIENHYDLPFYWLFVVGRTFVFCLAIGVAVASVAFTAAQSSVLVTVLVTAVSALLLLVMAYDLWVHFWKWRHWYLEIDGDEGAAWLHRPGSGSYFPYVSDKGSQYMPLLGAQVTKDEKRWYEQLIFKRSSTLSLDGDGQDDADFKNLRFIRDSWRIKNIIVAYNQHERGLERAQNDHLANIEASNARIVEQNDVLIAQNERIIALLEVSVSAGSSAESNLPDKPGDAGDDTDTLPAADDGE